MKKVIALNLIALLIFPAALFAKQVKLTTYYPAPYGDYKELKLQPASTLPACDANREGAMYYAAGYNDVRVCRNDGAGTYSWQLQPVGHQVCEKKAGGICYGPLVNALGDSYYYIAPDNTIKNIPKNGRTYGCTDATDTYTPAAPSPEEPMVETERFFYTLSEGSYFLSEFLPYSYQKPPFVACVANDAENLKGGAIERVILDSQHAFKRDELKNKCPPSPPVFSGRRLITFSDLSCIDAFCKQKCDNKLPCFRRCTPIARTLLEDTLVAGYQLSDLDHMPPHENEIR